MTDRIASFPNTNNLISQALQLQSDYNTADEQTASGLKSPYYSGIASDSQQLINLSSQYNTLNSYNSNITNTTNKVNIIQTAVSSIGDLLTTIKSQLTELNSGTNTTTDSSLTASQANSWATQLQSLLNTQYAGEYVFGGSVTDSAPVNISAPGYNPTSFSTPDTAYYQGNDTVATAQASSDLTVSYGITADNPAFEQVFRALSLVAANPTDSATLTSAQSLISSSADSVSDMGAELTTKVNILSNESQLQSATLNQLQTSISSLRDVDVAAASANLSQLNTQLQASYSALSLVLKLNLSQYLQS